MSSPVSGSFGNLCSGTTKKWGKGLSNIRRLGFPRMYSLPPSVQYSLPLKVLYSGTNIASSPDEDGIISCSKPSRLTEIQASGAPSRSLGAQLASISVRQVCEEHSLISLCQLEMRRYTFNGVERTVTCR